MAKTVENSVKAEVVESKFLDGTDKKWRIAKSGNKVTLCDCIDDFFEGKGEAFDFSRKMVSARTVTYREKQIEKNHFVIFYLVNGDLLITKRWNELN